MNYKYQEDKNMKSRLVDAFRRAGVKYPEDLAESVKEENYFKAIGSSFNEAVVIIPGDKVIIINRKNHVFEGTVSRIVIDNETNKKEFVVKLKNRQMEEVRVKGNKIMLYK